MIHTIKFNELSAMLLDFVDSKDGFLYLRKEPVYLPKGEPSACVLFLGIPGPLEILEFQHSYSVKLGNGNDEVL